jgi:hypothetical protein
MKLTVNVARNTFIILNLNHFRQASSIFKKKTKFTLESGKANIPITIKHNYEKE